ncbi:MAG: hypothetical protein ABSB61_03055 [Anaerolineales bacterium]
MLSQVVKRVILTVWRKFLGNEGKVSAGDNATGLQNAGVRAPGGGTGPMACCRGALDSPRRFQRWVETVKGCRLAVLPADAPIQQALEGYLDTLWVALQVGLDKETRTSDRIMEGQGR